MSERKEMSTETRSLMAAVLCLVVIAGWSLIYKPPQPAPIKPTPAARIARHARRSGSFFRRLEDHLHTGRSPQPFARPERNARS